MKKRFFFGLLALLLGLLWLLPACKKDDDPGPSVIQGRLTEYGTAAPVKDAKIYLSCDESQFGGPPVSKLFDSLSTDADGRFYKEYPAGEFCANVVIQPYKKGYFVPTPLDYVTVPKSYDFVMNPEAWLKIRAIPDKGNTQLDVFCRGGGTSFEHLFKSVHGDSTFVFPYVFFGNSNLEVIWDLQPSDKEFRDTIFCTAFDTTLYTIHY